MNKCKALRNTRDFKMDKPEGNDSFERLFQLSGYWMEINRSAEMPSINVKGKQYQVKTKTKQKKENIKR